MLRHEAEDEFTREWGSQISRAVKDLLEAKHLYQSVQVPDLQELAIALASKLGGGQGDFVQEQLAWANGLWSLMGPADPDYSGKGSSSRPRPSPRLPDLKIYCQKCGRREPYNPLSALDCTARSGSRLSTTPSSTVQVFVLSFLCQGCKSFPEFFFIRRDGLKLTLSGRTPIEHIDVANEIPKSLRQFLSDAIVAHQTGHTLAGLFYLRTAIEQWVRLRGHDQVRLDDALESYGETPPPDFRSRFPSLGAVYSSLSKALHAAEASSELFEQSLHGVERHFDARKVFDLDDQ